MKSWYGLNYCGVCEKPMPKAFGFGVIGDVGYCYPKCYNSAKASTVSCKVCNDSPNCNHK